MAEVSPVSILLQRALPCRLLGPRYSVGQQAYRTSIPMNWEQDAAVDSDRVIARHASLAEHRAAMSQKYFRSQTKKPVRPRTGDPCCEPREA